MFRRKTEEEPFRIGPRVDYEAEQRAKESQARVHATGIVDALADKYGLLPGLCHNGVTARYQFAGEWIEVQEVRGYKPEEQTARYFFVGLNDWHKHESFMALPTTARLYEVSKWLVRR